MKPDPEYLEALRASGQDPEHSVFRSRPDRWPWPRNPSSPFVPGKPPYSPPVMPQAEPFAEAELPALEQDALGVLFRGGYIALGDRIPWRGHRERWLASITPLDDDLAARVALVILAAVEAAARQEGETAFATLAELSADIALASAARLYIASKRAGERGAAAQKKNPTGRPSRIRSDTGGEARDAKQLDGYARTICNEVRRNPRLSVRSQAKKLWTRDLTAIVSFERFYDQMRRRCRSVLRAQGSRKK